MNIGLQKIIVIRNIMPDNTKNSEENISQKPTGPDVIAGFLKTLPNKPGVYRMMDLHENVLYVGKARSLKKRVQSYTRFNGHTTRIRRMISATAHMEFVTTKTEAEALLLEANLIKSLKPRYNVLLRDDKSFPYILVSKEHEAPQIVKHRGSRKNKPGNYYGPFASAGAVNRTVNTLQRGFLLRTCTDSIYEGRTRPCLLYQIKRCSAPCTGEISLPDYNALVDEANSFLRGESNDLRTRLQDSMMEASDRMEYEKAAEYRNRLEALSQIQQHQEINSEGLEETDIFAAYQEGGMTCIQVFFFRIGQNWGTRSYFPRADKSIEVEDVLDAFIAQFYNDKPIPKLILLSHEVASKDLLKEALCQRAERKVTITTPQRGNKNELVSHALTNAREALGRKLAESASQERLLEGMSKVLGLDEPAKRVEVYDNSHIQGAHAVGAMIVAGPEGFMKNQYRKFNIKSTDITPGDDFGMMREVLTRRFTRLLKDHGTREENSIKHEDDDSASPWPDLLLIDGGKGQLSATMEVLEDIGVSDVAVVGVAKGPDRNAGREHFYFPDGKSFMLELKDPVLYFIQRLRDEVHRFAIGTHRAKRKQAISSNPLDDVPGIGPTRKRSLLRHFGSAKAVSRAGVTDLQAVDGISHQIAQTIYDHFHDNDN